jgi:4-hydroxy-L-threonine phosphate dehydrogenase PdxA
MQANCVLLGDAAFLALTASYDRSRHQACRRCPCRRCATAACRTSARAASAVIDVPLDAHVVPGKLDKENGRAVLATLDLALEGVQPAGSTPSSPRRCKKAPSTTPASRFPAIPNTWPRRPAPARS